MCIKNNNDTQLLFVLVNALIHLYSNAYVYVYTEYMWYKVVHHHHQRAQYHHGVRARMKIEHDMKFRLYFSFFNFVFEAATSCKNMVFTSNILFS